MRPILVTGASGFIGSAVTELFRQHSIPVVGMARRNFAAPSGVRTIAGDLRDRDAVEKAVQGVRAVVHLAARVHNPRESGDAALAAHADYVKATQHLAEAAANAGADRFVLMSSVAVYGSAEGVISEGLEPRPDTPYGFYKLAAEKAVFGAAQGTSMAAVALRPPGVFGPRMKGGPLRLFQLVLKGTPIPVPREDVTRALIFSGNLAWAVLHLIRADLSGARVAVVADQRQLPIRALVERIAAALNRPARCIPLPRSLLKRTGYIGDGLQRLGLNPPATSREISRLIRTIEVDDRYIRQRLGYAQPVEFSAALDAAAQWMLTPCNRL